MRAPAGVIAAALAAWPLPSPVLAAESVIINAGEFPPYVSETLPGYGPHALFIRRVFAKAGIEVEILPWKRAYDEAKLGAKVATFPWLKTPEREIEMLYPKVPIEMFRDVVIYRPAAFPGGVNVTSLEELVARKLRIVGVSSYWYVPKLKEMGANLHLVSQPELAYSMILADRADVHINVDKVAQMEINTFFSKAKAGEFALSAGAVQESPGNLIFSRMNPRGPKLMKIWEEFAAGESLETPTQ